MYSTCDDMPLIDGHELCVYISLQPLDPVLILHIDAEIMIVNFHLLREPPQ